MNEKWNLNAKSALITGAGKGIGRAIASEFAALGANVTAAARSLDDLESLVEEIRAAGHNCNIAVADVTLPDDRQRLIRLAAEKSGGLDFLVNNAGTNIRKKTIDYSDDEVDFLIDINFRAAYEMCKAAYPLLRRSKSASIVNIGSLAARSIVKTGAPYASAKAALAHLTRYLAVEWGPENIRVNTIEPWYIKTPLTEPVLNNEIALAKILERTPLGRVGDVTEISALAAFLCMNGASYITGQVVAVDGAASNFLF